MGIVGVIDIGTVTCRLGIARVRRGRVESLEKHAAICNLGQGVAQTGSLSHEACERVVSCVRGYLEQAACAGVSHACCTLTSAARDAANADELLAGLRALGVEPEVIAGQTEGSLTFLGVAQDFVGSRIVVADNGGGSTEVAVGILGKTGLDLGCVRSLDVGCRRVTDLYFTGEGPICPEELERARGFCRDIFARELPAAARLVDGAASRLACVGGTATTLVAISAALDPYDSSFVHLHELSLAEVDRIASMLAGLSLEQRRRVVGLQPKRADVIVAGALCVSELMRACGADVLTVSESDLLCGLALVADAALRGSRGPIGWRPALFCVDKP